MNIKKWIWFYGRKDNRCYGYLYNPYLKTREVMLDLYNVIHESNLTLKDVKIRFED